MTKTLLAALLLATSLPAGAATITTLASFVGANGRSPEGGLIADASGNLIGTTRAGGAFDRGTLFRLDVENSALTTLMSFNGANGWFPTDDLTANASGVLFGTTLTGGPMGFGSVFQFDPVSSTLTTFASFDGFNGRSPQGGLVVSPSGDVYGTTRYYGFSPDLLQGSVFRVTAGGNAVTTLATFNSTNGSEPLGGVTADASGNLFGTTLGGGMFNQGTVFRLIPGTSEFTTLVNFEGASGEQPYAALIADVVGNLYGTTDLGGASGQGTVFRLDAVTRAATTLASFDGIGDDGYRPRTRLLADAAGNLFGTTSFGGVFGRGAVFRLDAGSSAVTTIASFEGTNGSSPESGLTADAFGNLFGTTRTGGTLGAGTVYKVTGTGFVPWTATRGGALTAGGALTTRNANAEVADFAGGVLPLPTIGAVTGVTIAPGSILNVRRAPGGVTGEYLSIGFGEVTFDLGGAISYFGLHAGSPDEYNVIEFFAGSGAPGVLGAAIDVPGFGTVINGTELANVFGAPLYGNEYYNFSFSLLQDVQFVRLSSTNTAFEIGEMAWELFGGSIVAAQAQVPAPGAALLMLGGLGLMAARRRGAVRTA